MNRTRLLLASVLAALALGTVTAAADIKNFRDWLAACDNLRNCSAYALNEYSTPAYLRFERGADPNAVPRITIDVDVAHGATVSLSFDDATLGGLPKGAFAGPQDTGPAHIEIVEPAAVEAFVASLRKAKTIIATATAAPGNAPNDPAVISLSGAAAALLWIDEQQKRLGTVTALMRRGDKPASAVPPPPAAPIVVAAKPGTAVIPATFPAAVLAKGRKICGPDEPNPAPVEANRLSGNLILYWFSCAAMSGAYNSWHGLVIAPLDRPDAARVVSLPYPPRQVAIEGIPKHLVVNANFDDKTLTLTIFAKSRGPGDCGAAGEWVWDGKDFQLVRYQAMPKCAFVTSEDWPVIYRATRK